MSNSSRVEVSGARLAGIAGLLGLALVSAGCSPSKGEAPPPAESAAGAAIVVTTAAADTRVVPVAIDATGSFAADETSDVAPEVDGVIASTPVDVGAYVRKGAVLIRLDATEASLRLQQAQAAQQQAEAALRQAEARVGQTASGVDVRAIPEVAAARANYESALAQSKQAQADVNRYRSLLATGDIARTVYEQAETRAESAAAQADAARQQYEAAMNGARQSVHGIESARAALASARAQVALAQDALRKTVVRAPMDGYVSERPVAVGEWVTRNAKVVTLLKVTPIKLLLQVPEAEAGSMRRDLDVVASVQAYPGREFRGKITAPNPAIDPKTRAMTVEATFPNPDILLKPGMFAGASIQQPDGRPAVVVPDGAVQPDPNTDSHRVYVVENGTARLRIVQTGRAAAHGLATITSGLQLGETVATSNLSDLYDGARVSVQAGA